MGKEKLLKRIDKAGSKLCYWVTRNYVLWIVSSFFIAIPAWLTLVVLEFFILCLIGVCAAFAELVDDIISIDLNFSIKTFRAKRQEFERKVREYKLGQ